jgi:hypothetical protein
MFQSRVTVTRRDAERLGDFLVGQSSEVRDKARATASSHRRSGDASFSAGTWRF